MDKYKLSDYTHEEEAEWLKKELLNEEATSLFSTKSTWFRFSKYEIITHPNNKDLLYIVPQKGSVIERYKPFDQFPNILADFMEMLLNLVSISKSVFKNKEEKLKLEYKKAEILLEFVSKYGLFGLFWNDVQKISFTRTDSGKETLVHLKSTPFSPKYTEIKDDIKASTVDYHTYASLFLPRLRNPYPLSIIGMGEEKEFFNNYGEPIKYIIQNKNLKRLSSHLINYLEFKQKTNIPNDKLQEECTHKCANALKTYIDDIGLEFFYEDNIFKLSWKYKSLIDALSIMYLMNLTNQMGQEVKICQLKECNKAFIGRGKYCCKTHSDRDRQRRLRAK